MSARSLASRMAAPISSESVAPMMTRANKPGLRRIGPSIEIVAMPSSTLRSELEESGCGNAPPRYDADATAIDRSASGWINHSLCWSRTGFTPRRRCQRVKRSKGGSEDPPCVSKDKGIKYQREESALSADQHHSACEHRQEDRRWFRDSGEAKPDVDTSRNWIAIEVV